MEIRTRSITDKYDVCYTVIHWAQLAKGSRRWRKKGYAVELLFRCPVQIVVREISPETTWTELFDKPKIVPARRELRLSFKSIDYDLGPQISEFFIQSQETSAELYLPHPEAAFVSEHWERTDRVCIEWTHWTKDGKEVEQLWSGPVCFVRARVKNGLLALSNTNSRGAINPVA